MRALLALACALALAAPAIAGKPGGGPLSGLLPTGQPTRAKAGPPKRSTPVQGSLRLKGGGGPGEALKWRILRPNDPERLPNVVSHDLIGVQVAFDRTKGGKLKMTGYIFPQAGRPITLGNGDAQRYRKEKARGNGGFWWELLEKQDAKVPNAGWTLNFTAIVPASGEVELPAPVNGRRVRLVIDSKSGDPRLMNVQLRPAQE
jgi:hypothetical protein